MATLTIGDVRITMTDEQTALWSAEDIIYPCDVDNHGWHFNPEWVA